MRAVTFLPDRYIEKISTENDLDVERIQKNLTEKMVLLFYRFRTHFPDSIVNYPLFDHYSIIDDKNIGDDLILKLPEKFETTNNLLNDIIHSMNEYYQKNTKKK